MIKDHLIIFFPLADWDDPWQRYQHLALGFSRTNRVIYVNPPAAITYLRKSPSNLMKKWLRFIKGKKNVNSNLQVYYPPPCLPFERISKCVNRLNQYILFLYLKILVNPKDSIILWINDPYKYLMIQLLKPKIAVYDCPDAIVFQNNGRKQRIYDQLKKKILRGSTLSFFTSKALLNEGRKESTNCFYVPNGVDIRSFRQTSYGVPQEMRKLGGTILGVVGTFDERIDIDLVNFVLEKVGDVTLVFVGPIQSKTDNLKKHPRVIFTGKKNYKEIPGFINRFDVALIPYRINAVTTAVYPVKLHEYLMLGKPVISTDLPEVRQFSDIVIIADRKEEFVSQIWKAFRNDDESQRRRRIEVARNNSWEKRITEISKYMRRYL
ncbi:MAG: glycosyltransferase [Candidatus Hodarchaeota archaeon]